MELFVRVESQRKGSAILDAYMLFSTGFLKTPVQSRADDLRVLWGKTFSCKSTSFIFGKALLYII